VTDDQSTDLTDDADETEEEEPDFWVLLETPPPGCEAVANLWSWSTNYDAGKGPASLFLDLIGWSADNLGQAIYVLGDASGLGYVELGKLAAALTEYADRPHDVRQYVETLLDAEGSR
jgi:hypothetical protein